MIYSLTQIKLTQQSNSFFMKKLFLFLIISLIIGCAPDPINIDKLNRGRGRSAYFSNETNKPYTGRVFFRDNRGKTFLQGRLKDGEKDGIWVYFTEQGRKFEGIFKVLPPPMYTGCVFNYLYYGDSIVVGYQNFKKGISDGPQKYINVEEGVLEIVEVNHSFSQRDGKYNYYNYKGDKEETTYLKGLREGKATESYSDGSKNESQYVNGVLEGPSFSFNSNGDTIAKYTYVNGEKNGPYTFSLGGEIEEGFYVNGKRNGKYRYFSNGSLLEGTYINDVSHGEYTWYSSEGDIEEGTYVNGKRQGKYKYVSNNGGGVVTGTFINDLKVGEYTWYKPGGGVVFGHMKDIDD